MNPKFNQHEMTGLDLGCGAGDKIMGFSEKFKAVLAVDISENAIALCNKKFDSNIVKFKCCNALNIKERFNVITAFRFSLFNTNDNTKFVSLLEQLMEQNLKKNEEQIFIISSFTDFSGTGLESWYKHTKKDIKEIKHAIENSTGLNVRVIFPHKKLKNYIGWGVYNFFAELGKLIIKRNKIFFIIVDNG